MFYFMLFLSFLSLFFVRKMFKQGDGGASGAGRQALAKLR